MTTQNRMASFLDTMKWEGGSDLSLNKSDPGNWTGGKVGVGELKGSKWGVAASSYPQLDIKNLTSDQAIDIFIKNYWTPMGGDMLPDGLDHCVTDDAYNSGTTRAQGRLNLMNANVTTNSVVAKIHLYSRYRLSFLEALRTWKIFGKGWLNRVVGVEAESVKMSTSTINRTMLLTKEVALTEDDRDSAKGSIYFFIIACLIILWWDPNLYVRIPLFGTLIYLILAAGWNFFVHKERARILRSLQNE